MLLGRPNLEQDILAQILYGTDFGDEIIISMPEYEGTVH
jgi:hypothetical protein